MLDYLPILGECVAGLPPADSLRLQVTGWLK